MADIIPIGDARRSLRPAAVAAQTLGPAKVMLFTGVRYEKHDGETTVEVAGKCKAAAETALKS